MCFTCVMGQAPIKGVRGVRGNRVKAEIESETGESGRAERRRDGGAERRRGGEAERYVALAIEMYSFPGFRIPINV